METKQKEEQAFTAIEALALKGKDLCRENAALQKIFDNITSTCRYKSDVANALKQGE